jgi:putative membrane protein
VEAGPVVAEVSLEEGQVAAGKDSLNTELIEKAVQSAEHGHHGEIFPLILKQSDFYPAAHFRSALLLALITPMTMYYLPYEFSDPIWYLWAQIPALIMGYLLCYHRKLKRFFSTRSELDEEVHQKAVESFLEFGLTKTKKSSAVLIMVSLLEHRVKILADHGYEKFMSEKDWSVFASNLAQEIKKNNLEQGIIDTIEEIGKVMLKHFPLKEGEINHNELADSSSAHTHEKTTQENLKAQDD